MANRLQVVFQNLGVYLLWIGIVILATITAFQLHTTVIYLGLLVVENPSLRPTGWTTGSIDGLSRLVWLILGIIWLGLVTMSESYLVEGLKEHKLRNRVVGMVVGIALVYGLSYLLLVLL